MNVLELRNKLNELIAEGKQDYKVTSFNGDFNYASWRYDNADNEATVEIFDDFKRVDISVGTEG